MSVCVYNNIIFFNSVEQTMFLRSYLAYAQPSSCPAWESWNYKLSSCITINDGRYLSTACTYINNDVQGKRVTNKFRMFDIQKHGARMYIT